MVLSAPYDDSMDDIKKDEIHANIENLAALLRLYVGNNFLRDNVYDVEVDVKSRDMKINTGVKMLADKVQGPNLNAETIEEMLSINQSIMSEKNRGGYELALNAFEYASQVEIYQKVIYYWVAIDILLEEDHGIYATFKEIYFDEQNKNPLYYNEVLGLEMAKDVRNNYQHDGIKFPLNESQERYLHMLFLDLIRHKLKLPCKKHLANFIRATGFDIAFKKAT